MSLILATNYVNIHKICADCLPKLHRSHSTEKQMARGKNKPSRRSKRWKHPERSRRWTDRDTTIYEHKELFYYQIWKVPNKILAYYFQVYIFKKTISQKKSWKLLNITSIIGSTRNDSLSPLRTLSCKVHPEGGQVLREVAIMAESSEGSTDLASLLRTNKVEALQATVFCGPVKFIVWTRLPEDSSSWILK